MDRIDFRIELKDEHINLALVSEEALYIWYCADVQSENLSFKKNIVY